MGTKRQILISVTNKTDIEKFGVLVDQGWEILSTGGTAKVLKEAGIPCTLIEDVTEFPEMMNGRLKTIHPKVFGGILADRSKPEHLAKIAEHGIDLIDVVVVNLYDFEGEPDIETIDIGGPSLIRAAAKNCASVTVVVDPGNYDMVIGEIARKGDTTPLTRNLMAAMAFEHTAKYDFAIAEWMSRSLTG